MPLFYQTADNGNPEDEETQWTQQQPDSKTHCEKVFCNSIPADLVKADTDTLDDIDKRFFNRLQNRR